MRWEGLMISPCLNRLVNHMQYFNEITKVKN